MTAIAVILLALGVITIALRRAPEAREDGTGFHFVDEAVGGLQRQK